MGPLDLIYAILDSADCQPLLHHINQLLRDTDSLSTTVPVYLIHSILKLEKGILYSCFGLNYITTVGEGREAKHKQIVLDLLVNNQDLSGRSSWPCLS